MNSNSIIRMNNAGFEIMDAIFTNDNNGFCIGVSPNQYVTWWFTTRGEKVQDISFYHGHYFMVDRDSPNRSRAKAMADFYLRVSQGFDQTARYGY